MNNSSPSCGCPSGTPFNTPTPGSLVVVPFGSQVVQTPQAYPCGGEATQSTGSVAGGESSPSGGVVTAFAYPVIKSDFNMVPFNAVGSFLSQNALLWAIVGASAWIAPLGYVTITGVSGEVVSFKNVSVPGGTLIREGSTILISPPSLSSGSAGDVEALDNINGTLNGEAGTLNGEEGQMLKVVGGRWQGSAGMVYAPFTSPVTIYTEAFGTGAMSPTTKTITLQNLPNPLPPRFAASLTIELTGAFVSSNVANSFTVKRNGVMLAGLSQYVSVAHPIVTIDGSVSPLFQVVLEKLDTNAATVTMRLHGFFF